MIGAPKSDPFVDTTETATRAFRLWAVLAGIDPRRIKAAEVIPGIGLPGKVAIDLQVVPPLTDDEAAALHRVGVRWCLAVGATPPTPLIPGNN